MAELFNVSLDVFSGTRYGGSSQVMKTGDLDLSASTFTETFASTSEEDEKNTVFCDRH